MSVDLIDLWHQRARPKPTDRDFQTQLGCHFEEVAEMLDALIGVDDMSEYALMRAKSRIQVLAEGLKQGEFKLRITERKDFLDSIADQVVTGVGVGHCTGMKTTEAVRRVNTSNWSKYDHEGKPIFDQNGKITKGPNYEAPDLNGLY